MTVVDVLDMEFATNAFHGRPVECIPVHDRRESLLRISALTAGKTALVVPERSSHPYPSLRPYCHWQGIRRMSARVPCGAVRLVGLFVTVLTGSIVGAARRIALKFRRLAVGHCDPCALQCGQTLSCPTLVSTAASEASPTGRPARTSPASAFRARGSPDHSRQGSRRKPGCRR